MSTRVAQYLSRVNPVGVMKEKAQEIIIDIKHIPLKKLPESITRNAHIEPITETDVLKRIVLQYLNVKSNLYRAWNKTKNKELLHPLLFCKKLQPLEEELQSFHSRRTIEFNAQMMLLELKPYLDEFLHKYEELHTKQEDEDDIFAMLGELGEEF